MSVSVNCLFLIVISVMSKAMSTRISVKRPRARRFWSPQSNKKNKFVEDIFLNNYEVPGFRKKSKYSIIKTINIHVIPSTYLCEY